MWEMPEKNKAGVVKDLEDKFEFLMEKLGVFNTKDIVTKYIKTDGVALPAYREVSEELTAAATIDANEGE